jgi:hypothetical protein
MSMNQLTRFDGQTQRLTLIENVDSNVSEDLAARLIAARFGLEFDIAKLICALAGIGGAQ